MRCTWDHFEHFVEGGWDVLTFRLHGTIFLNSRESPDMLCICLSYVHAIWAPKARARKFEPFAVIWTLNFCRFDSLKHHLHKRFDPSSAERHWKNTPTPTRWAKAPSGLLGRLNYWGLGRFVRGLFFWERFRGAQFTCRGRACLRKVHIIFRSHLRRSHWMYKRLIN